MVYGGLFELSTEDFLMAYKILVVDDEKLIVKGIKHNVHPIDYYMEMIRGLYINHY